MKAVVATLVMLVLAIEVRAAQDQSRSLEDVTVIENGEGLARILFRIPPIAFSDRTVIQRASLRIPYTGETEERRLDLRICSVTESWEGGGDWNTDFDVDLYSPAIADLSRGSGVAVFDLTVLLKENLEEGIFADGFVLTTGSEERPGIDESDLSRFSSLVGAEFEITTTKVPSRRTHPDR